MSVLPQSYYTLVVSDREGDLYTPEQALLCSAGAVADLVRQYDGKPWTITLVERRQYFVPGPHGQIIDATSAIARELANRAKAGAELCEAEAELVSRYFPFGDGMMKAAAGFARSTGAK